MALNRLTDIIEKCYDGGQHWWQPIRKRYGLAGSSGYCYDMSISTGLPRPNYYIGNALTATAFNGDYGIWHGGNCAPATKHLHKIGIYGDSVYQLAATHILCDYLVFYPLIDGDSGEEQLLTNTVALPRYTDGKGVRAFLVATNPYTSNGQVTFTYTNHLGVTGCQGKLSGCNGNTTIGTILTSGVGSPALCTGPWLEPQDLSDGIRSVQSITFLSPPGGLHALVLCRPLAEVYGREQLAAAEWDLFTMQGGKLPRIYDGAFLSFVTKASGSLQNTTLFGDLTFIWN